MRLKGPILKSLICHCRRAVLWAVALACLAVRPPQATAKEQVARTATQRVWPAPPEEPRIAFVQYIFQPQDAGSRVSGFRRFSNWLSGDKQGNERLVRPFAVAVDEADNLCLTDVGAVCFFEQATKRWQRWEQVGGKPFNSPLAVAKRGKTLFVADVADAAAGPAVVAFDTDGKLLFRISEHLSRPVGLAISGERLLVADCGAHCICSFDLKGKFLGSFGTRGTGPGEFNFPTHIAVDQAGDIYVTDSLNGRVQVLGSNGGFKRQIGSPGDALGSFSRPKGVAIDSAQRAYVVDAVADNLQIFDSQSRLLLDVGHPGSEPGEFWLPSGIAITSKDRIYVADSYNSRIQVFQFVGKQ